MIPTEDILPIVKNKITASIKYNTYRGFIGWRDCDSICMDMHDCLDMWTEPFEKGEYMVVLEVAAYILTSGTKLASHADSSSGMLTDVTTRSLKLVEKYTKEIAKQEKQIRDSALALIIKEAKKKAYDEWEDWRYDLLKCGICLCDEKSAKKLEKIFDVLLEREVEDFLEYERMENMLARYLLHRHLRGKEATKEELYENINIKEFRIIAIKDAMEDKDFSEAERLCLEKVEAQKEWHYRRGDSEDWNNLLFEIYETAGDTNKQIVQAKRLLLLGNEKFWDTLKRIYKKDGVWEEKYEELLDELRDSKKAICYRSVLIAENEKKRLLDNVQENPFDLFYYGDFLVEDYPEQIYELCYQAIRDNCAQAKDRREYKRITKQILQLIKWKGNDTAKELITELKQTYPRRTALLDELQKVERKM